MAIELDEANRAKLAEQLHFIMEKLDPTAEPEWNKLTDHEREFYALVVRDMWEEIQAIIHEKVAAELDRRRKEQEANKAKGAG